MKRRVAIIGCGQLGSRHLQSMASANPSWEVHAVDPSPDSLKIARERFEQAKGTLPIENVVFHSSIDELPDSIDCGIIATSADIRKMVLDALLRSKDIRYLILEKILFQSVADYDYVGNELDRRKIAAWVNCPQRLYPVYQKLKKSMTAGGRVLFSASGNNWGLACNAIHYLDLFCFLSGQGIRGIDIDTLDAEIRRSKRIGFSEVTGTIRGTSQGGSSFALASFNDTFSPVTVSIATPAIHAIIREGDAKYWFSEAAGKWVWHEKNFEILYQSGLTYSIVNDMLDSGACGLPTFAESAKLHLLFLNVLLNHFERVLGARPAFLPIT